MAGCWTLIKKEYIRKTLPLSQIPGDILATPWSKGLIIKLRNVEFNSRAHSALLSPVP